MAEAPPDESLRPALEALAGRDAALADAYRRCGLPPVRRSAPGFPGLIRMIIGQQVSVASAAAMVRRLEAAVSPVSAEAFLTLDDGRLREIGFSRQKVRSGRGLAEEIASGRLDLDALAELDDDAAVVRLTRLRGRPPAGMPPLHRPEHPPAAGSPRGTSRGRRHRGPQIR